MTRILGSAERECYLPLMGRALSFCGVILAAGESSRMGRDKALLPWPILPSEAAATETFLSAAIRLFSSFVDVVFVVTGKNAPSLRPIVYANGASLVINPDPSRGQFSSLQAGLQEVLNRGRDAAMVTLVDRPPVRVSTLQSLQSAFENAIQSWKWAVVPEFEGKHGHPVLVAREMIEAFLKAPSSATAREIEHASQDKIVYVPVDDPLATMNIDTPEQYAALSSGALQPR